MIEQMEITPNLTLQDRIRLHLNSFGLREVPVTIQEIANQLDKPEASVYQAINIMRQRNELEVIKEPLDNGREKIVGIKINKLEPSGRTYKRAAERSGRVQRIQPIIDNLVPTEESISLTTLTAYLEKKLAVEDMKTRALAAGLDESVITFTPDPMGEEGIALLKAYTDLKHKHEALVEEHQMQGFDLAAERRNVEFLEGRLREDTNKMLLEHSES